MKKKFYMIGNAHLDPVWMWHWQEGCAETKATVRSALDRMNEYPDFKFVCSSASIYEWLEASAPEMADEVRERIKEGRWIVVGGWWVQPDCNLPSGEGFARQSLYSQRYFKEHFGTIAETGYCVDSFGHNRMLPQILRKSGMKHYVFQRPGATEIDLPHNLFLWESPDGSRVMTKRILEPYCTNFQDMEALCDVLQRGDEWEDKGYDTKPESAMILYGVGNHGGGPTIQNIELIHEYQKAHPETEMIFSDPVSFFRSEEIQKLDLPVWTDDLQHHAPGCYAAYSPIKTAIRKGETRLLAAEKYAVLGRALAGTSYPAERLAEAWKNVCFLHFHDIAGGCAIEGSYKDSLEFAGESLAISAKTENNALQAISWKIDTRDREKGLPVVIFNSHAWPIRAEITVNKIHCAVTDSDGNAIPTQGAFSETNSWYGGRSDTVFTAELPAMGYATYYLRPDQEICADTTLIATDRMLENEFLRVEFDANGHVCSLYDKRIDREFLSAPAVTRVYNEWKNDTWSHGSPIFGELEGRFNTPQIRLKETGPVRATIAVTTRYNDSTLCQEFSLAAGSDRVEVKVTLDWHEKHKIAKLAFPVNVEGEPSSYYNIPYGWIRRPCNNHEEPGQMWVSLQDNKYGLVILNDQKYSFSADGAELRMTAVRSPIFADHGGPRVEDSRYTDQGEMIFRYALVPYVANGEDFRAVARIAEEFNTPPVHIVENNHEGVLADCYSGLSTESDRVIVSAVKAAEDGNGVIIRAYETAGESGAVTISVPMLDTVIDTDFGPFEVKTFRVAADGVVSETLLTEYEVE